MNEWSVRVEVIGELGAIGRPTELAGLSFGMDELGRFGVVIEADGPDFIFAEEDQAVASGRYGWVAAFGDFARRASERGNPDGLFDALRKACGVRVVAMVFEISAAYEDEGAAVGGPSELGDLLAIVIVIVRKAAAGVSGGVGEPDVARAMLIENPGDGAAFGGGGEIRREWSAHYLFEREARGGGREGEGTREKKAE